MKVKDLINKLTQLDPEALIVVSAHDHNYREIRSANQVLAEAAHDDDCLHEYYEGPGLLPTKGHYKLNVVVME